ncbi:MAG: hypothetical protein ACYS8X_10955 [Planctomycetota bacterium]|jgi:hypothetical protein
MSKLPKVALLAVLVVGGCVSEPAPVSAERDNVDAESGNLIAFWLQYPDREEPVLVTEPYAVFIVWLEEEKLFFVHDNQARRTFKTTDFDEFLSKIRQLPRDIAVQRLDTCTNSQAYKMPPAAAAQLAEAMKSGDRTWAISKANGLDHEIICYCETTGFRYP